MPKKKTPTYIWKTLGWTWENLYLKEKYRIQICTKIYTEVYKTHKAYSSTQKHKIGLNIMRLYDKKVVSREGLLVVFSFNV